MSEPKHHHYVPKVYLREFGVGNGKDLKVLTQDIRANNFYAKKVSIGNEICQDEDFYKINTNDSFLGSFFGEDPNVVEKNGFKYEKYLPKIFDKLKPTNFSHLRLLPVEAVTLMRALLSIKFRNRFVRETYLQLASGFEERALKTKLERLNYLEEEKNKYSGEGKEIFEEIIEEYKKKVSYDLDNLDEFLKAQHSTTIYSPNSVVNKKLNFLGNHLLRCKWEIVHTLENKQFITSDNPGVFLSTDGKVYTLIFDTFKEQLVDRFFFPLSSLNGLLIHLLKGDTISNANKMIRSVAATERDVFEYNTCHCCYVNNILIASNENALKDTFEKGKSQWIDVKTRE